jgi:hypothetical protein
MVDRVYTERADSYYYDPEGVRYRRSGQEGQYSYEQVASVLEGVVDDDQVSSPTADAMVSRALVLATGESPPREPTPPMGAESLGMRNTSGPRSVDRTTNSVIPGSSSGAIDTAG